MIKIRLSNFWERCSINAQL